MTARRLSFVSWLVSVAATLATSVLLGVGVGRATPGDEFVVGGWGGLAFAVVALSFGTVGALVSRRLPGHRVGWVFCLIGMAVALGNLAYHYADIALFVAEDPWPGGLLAANLQNLTIPPAFGLIAVSLMLFPDGRLPSARWRAAVAVALAGSSFEVIGYALRPGPLDDPFAAIDNPTGVVGGFAVFDTMSAVGWPLMGVGLVLAALSLRRRSRRAAGLERQQLKWITLAAAVAGVMIAAVFSSFLIAADAANLNLVRTAALGTGLCAIPAGAGVAILRYRLYDIDVVINRALVYGSLTALLAGTYLGSVLLLQLLLERFTSGSGLAVAASTLATAALVRPARTRIQAAVDRRFFRAKYDAAQTLENFGAAMRQQVDLDATGAGLRAVVAETLQPAHLSVWVRPVRSSR